jgi:hypothetical protein
LTRRLKPLLQRLINTEDFRQSMKDLASETETAG